MKKICFLFGAGAEGGGQFGLPTGALFNRDLLVSESGATLFNALNGNDYKKYLNIRRTKNIHYNNYLSLYYLYQQSGKFRSYLNVDEKKICEDYIQSCDCEKEDEDDRKKAFKKLFRTRFYKKIVDNDIKDDDYTLNFFLENSLLIDNLDSCFNSLSCPEKFKNEAGRVVNCFCSAYFSVYSKLYGSDCPQNRNEIIEKLNNPFGCLDPQTDSYYKSIRNIVKKYKDIEFAFCTTNYTRIAENIICCDKPFCYIHGRIDLFENIVTKEIKTLGEFTQSDIIFPYLAIRSGIKPIISGKQIAEWNKFVSYVDDSDLLIVVGYGFNTDDEHITNIIREATSSKLKKIYQTNYCDSVKHTNSIPGIEGVIPIDCEAFEEQLEEICKNLRSNGDD